LLLVVGVGCTCQTVNLLGKEHYVAWSSLASRIAQVSGNNSPAKCAKRGEPLPAPVPSSVPPPHVVEVIPLGFCQKGISPAGYARCTGEASRLR